MEFLSVEEVKKLLVSSDFSDDTYKDMSIQNLIVLKNSAQKTGANATDEKVRDFYQRKEMFYLHLILRAMQNLDTLYCMFSKNTRLPYVMCDEETMSDQVLLYTSEQFIGAARKKLANISDQLMFVKIENKDFLSFFSSLFPMGVNELILDKWANSMPFELTSLVKKPDYSNVPEIQRPVSNPELLLTAIYFSEEKTLPDGVRNDAKAADYEDEMLANIKRGRLIVPIILPEGVKKPEVKDMKMPIFKTKNGQAFQAVCTDMDEFRRMNPNGQMKWIIIPGSELKTILRKDTVGVMINPSTLKVVIPNGKLL